MVSAICLKGGRRKSIEANRVCKNDQETNELPQKKDRKETFRKTVRRQKANHCVICNKLKFNTLTANYEYSRSNRENLPSPIQMQLSKKPKTFCCVFLAF